MFIQNINMLIAIAIALLYNINDTEAFKCNKPKLEITVGPDSKHIYINWFKENHENGDWIGLYSAPPNMQNSKQNQLDFFEATTSSGWEKTKIKFEEKVKTIDYKKSINLGYYAVYWRKKGKTDEAVTTTKFNTFPDWMKVYWDKIGHRQINQIFIPGTHDSVSKQGLSIQIKPEINKKKGFRGYLSGIAEAAAQAVLVLPVASGITYTQDTSITEQLLLGVRYLDIRILKSSTTYWTAHSDMKMVKLEEVIRDVVNFVENTEKEIVIFDIHELISGVSKPEEHDALIKFLKENFTKDKKQWWVPLMSDPWKKTLNDIIHTGGRVIVSYIDYNIQQNNNQGILWPKVNQLWGDKNDIHELRDYFFKKAYPHEMRSCSANAAMAELTPRVATEIDKIKEELGPGLDIQAETNAKEINSWFMTPELGSKTNILAVDFVRGMGTVRSAFIWNTRMAQTSGDKNCDPQDSIRDQYYQHNILY